jgi:hypothetical protein
LVSYLHYVNVVRGNVFAPASHRSAGRTLLGAGWRRASRLAGLSAALIPGETLREAALPLDRGEKSAIVKSVDATVPPDQPPSTVDSPASRTFLCGLSASGFAFESSTPPLSERASVTSPGCGVTPSGLTY